MTPFTPGDRCSTPTRGSGAIQPPLWDMPHHHLVQFDSGELWWVLRDALQPEQAIKPARRASTGRKAA